MRRYFTKEDFSMKKSRKLLSVLLALVLVFSVCAVAYADYPEDTTGTVTVLFTHDCSENTDGTNYWNGYNVNYNTLYQGGTVNIANLQNCTKTYIPTGTSDPMNGHPSVLDAIIASQPTYLYDLGWDANPYEGDPGAYVHNVQNTQLESHYTEIGGVHRSWGKGFVVIIEYYDGNNNFVREFPSEYVSNVPLSNGMVIYVDFAEYDYTW
jgi:hypothetical protein